MDKDRHFTKQSLWMASYYIKRFSALLVIREIKIKTSEVPLRTFQND